MNKEDIRKQLSQVMKNFYSVEGMTIQSARDLLLPFLGDLIYLYENDYLVQENDWRSGEDTYGYESEEAVLNDLEYISDRWGSAFRVRWVIDFLDPDYYPNREMIDKDYMPKERKF